MRSIAIRRRQRRAIEEAIRNGTYVSPEQRRRQKREKPKLYEAQIHDFDSAMDKWTAVVVRARSPRDDMIVARALHAD